MYERDNRRIITVVIYTANVKEADTTLDIGFLTYNPGRVMMYDYDGQAIYAELSQKIQCRQELTDIDMLNLIFLPLMRNNIPADTLAAESIKLAQTIPDITKRNAYIAAAFTFANKYLDKKQVGKLLEVLRITDLATMLVEEREIEIAKKLLKRGMSITAIAEDTGLDESTIEWLQLEMNNN